MYQFCCGLLLMKIKSKTDKLKNFECLIISMFDSNYE